MPAGAAIKSPRRNTLFPVPEISFNRDMPRHPLQDDLSHRIAALRAEGLFKEERELASPQDAEVNLADGRKALNLCANNYLGFGGHPALAAAARDALERWGYGLASVRFICGTQSLHRELEERLSAFIGTDDKLLFSSCF